MALAKAPKTIDKTLMAACSHQIDTINSTLLDSLMAPLKRHYEMVITITPSPSDRHHSTARAPQMMAPAKGPKKRAGALDRMRAGDAAEDEAPAEEVGGRRQVRKGPFRGGKACIKSSTLRTLPALICQKVGKVSYYIHILIPRARPGARSGTSTRPPRAASRTRRPSASRRRRRSAHAKGLCYIVYKTLFDTM